MKMKIYVDGSKRSAVSRMFPIWEKYGHIIVNKPEDANIQLSVARIKVNTGLPTVLRIDGIYYDLSTDYNKNNKGLSKSHQHTNAIAYQSDLSKRMCEKYLTKRQTKIFDIIHNGVEDWEGLYKEHSGINIVVCAKWRRHKRLPEMVHVFKQFLKTYPDSQLHILGPMKRGAKRISHPKVKYYDKVNEKEMKKMLEIADLSLHLSKKDSCPSSVVEAISAGVPVVTTDACGGATEMCQLTKGCLIATGEDLSLEPSHFYQNPYNVISKNVMNEIVSYMIYIIKNKIRVKLPPTLKIEYTAKKYLDLMEKII